MTKQNGAKKGSLCHAPIDDTTTVTSRSCETWPTRLYPPWCADPKRIGRNDSAMVTGLPDHQTLESSICRTEEHYHDQPIVQRPMNGGRRCVSVGVAHIHHRGSQRDMRRPMRAWEYAFGCSETCVGESFLVGIARQSGAPLLQLVDSYVMCSLLEIDVANCTGETIDLIMKLQSIGLHLLK